MRCPICNQLVRVEDGKIKPHNERRVKSRPWVNRCIGSGEDVSDPPPRAAEGGV